MGKTAIDPEFEVTEKMREWAREKVPGVDIESETEKFVDYWLAHGKRMADWTATWRNWMRRAPQFNRQEAAEDPYFTGRKYLC